MRPNVAPLTVLVGAALQTAVSAQTVNVQSLMGEGYTVAGVNTSVTGGGGVYLQKGKTLVYCYVTEKPGSESVDTQYCKPVK
jgi:lipoate-protein ligase A